MTTEEYKKLTGDERRQKPKHKDEEHQHQSAFFTILRLNYRRFPELRFIFAVPNAAKRNPPLAAYLVAEGLTAGVPDVIVPMPRRGYHAAFIENKIGNNKMSPAQIKFRDFLIGEGYFVKACYSVTEQTKTLEWYLKIELLK